jgi:hypothetical protein
VVICEICAICGLSLPELLAAIKIWATNLLDLC